MSSQPAPPPPLRIAETAPESAPSLPGARVFPVPADEGAARLPAEITARIVFDETAITFRFEIAFPFPPDTLPQGVILLRLHDPRSALPVLWRLRFGPDWKITGPGGASVRLHRETASPQRRGVDCTIAWHTFSAGGKRPPALRWSALYAEADAEPAPPGRTGWHRLDFDGAGGRNGHLWINARHVAVGEHGLLPRRISTTLLEAMTDSERVVGKMTAGIELQVHAPEAHRLRVRFRVLGDDGFPVAWALFAANRKRHPTRVLAEGGRQPQELSWRLSPERGAPQPLRLIFPLHAEIELLSLELESPGPVLAPAAPMRAGRVRWLAHGDSITHGANVTSPDFAWVELVARQLGLAPFNLGFGANARAQEWIAREIASLDDWDLLTLHLGINSLDTAPDQYRELYARFLGIIRAAHPRKPIVCVTPIIHSTDVPAETPPDLVRRNLRAEPIREAIRAVVAARAARDPHLHLIEGFELLSDLDQLLSDGAHPSDHGSAIIARELAARLAPVIAPLGKAE